MGNVVIWFLKAKLSDLQKSTVKFQIPQHDIKYDCWDINFDQFCFVWDQFCNKGSKFSLLNAKFAEFSQSKDF